jgi:glycosyltransferase involved in cell wall biosynthesis
MGMSNGPLVSVVTPVYNGEAYLAECIESVLKQTYSNWEYTIVDNCSKDGTRAIAEKYAQLDKRIKVHANETFLDIIANHNKAFSLISPQSKYCKQVSGDDWIFPECLAQMVAVAEAHPSVGILGSNQLSGGGDHWYLRTFGLPYGTNAFSGREIGRKQLLGKLNVVGNPTSNMYRADLVRRTDAFFPNKSAEADVSAIYNCLRDCDFGFVHQVISYERVHPGQITATSKGLNAYLGSKLSDLANYGSFYLTSAEIAKRTGELLSEYYKFLAVAAVNFRGQEFWKYHEKRLQDVGHPLDRIRLTGAVCAKLTDLFLNPKETVGRIARRCKSRFNSQAASSPGVTFGNS